MTWYDYGAIDPIDDVSTTWARTVGTLTLFNGRLWLGYGDWGDNVPQFATIVYYDLATGILGNLGTCNSNATQYMNVVNGQLALPYADLGAGTYPVSRFINTDDTSDEQGANSRIIAWHMFGSAYFGGKRYLSGAHYIGPSTNAYGVWRDDSGNWAGANNTPNSYVGPSTTTINRVYGLFVLGSTLYAGFSNNSMLKTTTGALGSWTSAGAPGTTLMKRPMIAGGVAYYGSGEPGRLTGPLFSFDGTTRTTVASSVWDHAVGDDGNLYYLDTSMNIKNVAGSTVETAPANSRSIAYVNGVWYAGTTDSHLWATAPRPTTNRVLVGSDLVKSGTDQVIYT